MKNNFLGSLAAQCASYGEFSINSKGICDTFGLLKDDCIGKIIYNTQPSTGSGYTLPVGYYKITGILSPWGVFETQHLGDDYQTRCLSLGKEQLKNADDYWKNEYDFIGEGKFSTGAYGNNTINPYSVEEITGVSKNDCIGKIIYNSEVSSSGGSTLSAGYWRITDFEEHNAFTAEYLGEDFQIEKAF